jgi:hypothetical protein
MTSEQMQKLFQGKRWALGSETVHESSTLVGWTRVYVEGHVDLQAVCWVNGRDVAEDIVRWHNDQLARRPLNTDG